MGIFIEHKQFWAGIIFNAPEKLVFGTENMCVDPELATTLGVGEVRLWWTGSENYEWRRDIDLESEEIHFFARSKASQMQFLEQFLRESLDLARPVVVSKTGDQKPEAGEDDTDS